SFLDAGNDERRVALRRPASKNLQGTKSREVSRRLRRERYGDYMSAGTVKRVIPFEGGVDPSISPKLTSGIRAEIDHRRVAARRRSTAAGSSSNATTRMNQRKTSWSAAPSSVAR